MRLYRNIGALPVTQMERKGPWRHRKPQGACSCPLCAHSMNRHSFLGIKITSTEKANTAGEGGGVCLFQELTDTSVMREGALHHEEEASLQGSPEQNKDPFWNKTPDLR